jgi:hypothetical protein
MATLVDFTRDDLVRDSPAFFTAYFTAHPDGYHYTASTLYYVFAGVLTQCRTLLDGYKFSMLTGAGYSSFLEGKQIYLLLCDMRFRNFSSQFRNFVIKKNDISLSDTDYILLFYVSLQSAEIQEIIRNLPLSMVYDMFLPVAEENLHRWKLSS